MSKRQLTPMMQVSDIEDISMIAVSRLPGIYGAVLVEGIIRPGGKIVPLD